MAYDWSIESGWFIFTMVLLFANLIYIVIRSWDIIRRARKEKREELIAERQIRKAKAQKDIDIQFINLRAKVRDVMSGASVKLIFDIRNMGKFGTTVHVEEIHLSYKGSTETTKASLSKDIGAKDMRKGFSIDLMIMYSSMAQIEIPTPSVAFVYTYIARNGKEVRTETNFEEAKVITKSYM